MKILGWVLILIGQIAILTTLGIKGFFQSMGLSFGLFIFIIGTNLATSRRERDEL
jgi:hypothetical protein